MAVRIAVALFTAFRAVLIYGEATQLATRPIELPRLRFARWGHRGGCPRAAFIPDSHCSDRGWRFRGNVPAVNVRESGL